MNILMLIASCAVAFVFLFFATLIFRSGLNKRLNRSSFMFISCFAVWVLLNYLSNISTIEPNLLLGINRALFVVSLIEPFFIAIFVSDLTQRKLMSIPFILLTILTLLSLIISVSPLVVDGVILSGSTASVGISFGPLASLYFITVILVAIYAVVALAFGIGSSHTKRVRASSKTLLLTIGFSVIAILITNVLLPVVFGRFDFSTPGLLFGALAIAGVGYSIVRHSLFDIRFAVVRSVTYSMVLLTLAGLYLGIAFAFSALFNNSLYNTNQILSGVIISLLLAFLFQPIKRFFDKITNRYFYKDNYNTDDFFARLNQTLSINTDLRGLLERAAYEIGTTLKSEQAFFFINTADGHYVSAGTDRHKQLPRDDAKMIGDSYNENNEVIVASLMDTADPVRRLMISHRIELVMTLVQDDKIVGYLCLGEHLTSGYTNRDIKVLKTISDELIIAIQNALAVQEIRELNATLQQKIAVATKELRSTNAILRQLDKVKDEFISMASHQLRTPLTTVKGYISMVMEGDAGKVSDAQKHLLDEAFMSSERMVHLINDFLNVSRIQTGKFIIDKTSVDLSKLVGEEIESLRPNALARHMKFKYDAPKSFPMMDVDEGKIRQVVMNYADNAIYYSREDSVIDIDLSVEGNVAVFTVKDTGIGVPKSERDHLFTKFYRASNARVQRPDGTGVGLYLAKKVIDAHGGEVIFDSVEGKGSTFGFRMPIITPSTSSEQK